MKKILMEVNAHAEHGDVQKVCLFSQCDVNKEPLPITLLDEPYYQESYFHGMDMD